jgi:hypothetical protein
MTSASYEVFEYIIVPLLCWTWITTYWEKLLLVEHRVVHNSDSTRSSGILAFLGAIFCRNVCRAADDTGAHKCVVGDRAAKSKAGLQQQS